jgi:hypothetical protein
MAAHIAPRPHTLADDDSDGESSVTRSSHSGVLPASHVHGPDVVGDERGEVATTPTKRKHPGEHPHRKRQTLKGGLRYNILDLLLTMIETGYLERVSLACCAW